VAGRRRLAWDIFFILRGLSHGAPPARTATLRAAAHLLPAASRLPARCACASSCTTFRALRRTRLPAFLMPALLSCLPPAHAPYIRRIFIYLLAYQTCLVSRTLRGMRLPWRAFRIYRFASCRRRHPYRMARRWRWRVGIGSDGVKTAVWWQPLAVGIWRSATV
jgi:hypothetical protein